LGNLKRTVLDGIAILMARRGIGYSMWPSQSDFAHLVIIARPPITAPDLLATFIRMPPRAYNGKAEFPGLDIAGLENNRLEIDSDTSCR